MGRLDVELVKRGLFDSRSKAKEAILTGHICCDGKLVQKVSSIVSDETELSIRGSLMPYVSRGGLKLEQAIRVFGIDFSGKTLLDIGSSTGGFTDCALQHGAKHVLAIDVGTDQMVECLRKDPRVTLLEQTDFRTIDAKRLSEATIASIDVSFISTERLLPKLQELSNLQEIVCLIKPQFECGKELADQYKGIVLNQEIHLTILHQVIRNFQTIGFTGCQVTYSPIRGGNGNIEYVAYFTKTQHVPNRKELEQLIHEAFYQTRNGNHSL